MNSLKEGSRVAVFAAMVQELRPVVKRYALHAEADRYHGRAGSHELAAAVTSIGTQAAARGATRLLDSFAADHVIVVGIAGAIAAGLDIGDLVSPERVVNEPGGEVVHPTPLGAGSPEPLGALLTGDALVSEPAEVERLRSRGFVAVDMETGAIGLLAERRRLPWSVFRAISDRVGQGVDPDVLALARADGSPDPAGVVRFLLTRPWRIPRLIGLARGADRAIETSTRALFEALEGSPADF